MSKVLTFSRYFPAYHPKAGQPTHFVEKIYKSIDIHKKMNVWDRSDLSFVDEQTMVECLPKHHTIRAGTRWKAGDKFSPRVWSGKPYNSPQIIIAPYIEVKKVWNVKLSIRGDFKEFSCGDTDLTGTSLNSIAQNDGLSLSDLLDWFNKPFEGQIICWNENVKY